jgi:peptide/nickel transport system permease protein
MIGIPLGLVSGYFQGSLDRFIMRAMDIMLAFPSALLAVCIVAILGPSLQNAMLAIGLVSVPQYARIVRGSVLSEREKEYVSAAKSLGQKDMGILLKGVLPNIIGPIIVLGSLSFATAVLEGAALSFIGLGAEPPLPEWGALLYEGKQNYYQAWWLIMFPGLAILLTVVGFNLLGDGLRDAFDPKRQLR